MEMEGEHVGILSTWRGVYLGHKEPKEEHTMQDVNDEVTTPWIQQIIKSGEDVASGWDNLKVFEHALERHLNSTGVRGVYSAGFPSASARIYIEAEVQTIRSDIQRHDQSQQ